MADLKISELSELAESPDAADMLPIVDDSASETKRISPKYLNGAFGPATTVNIDIADASITITGHHHVVTDTDTVGAFNKIYGGRDGDLLILHTESGTAIQIQTTDNVKTISGAYWSMTDNYTVVLIKHGDYWRQLVGVSLDLIV